MHKNNARAFFLITLLSCIAAQAFAASPVVFYSQPVNSYRVAELNIWDRPTIATTFTAAQSGFLTSVEAYISTINCTRPIRATLLSVDSLTGLPSRPLAASLNAPAVRAFSDFIPVSWTFDTPITLQQGTVYALQFSFESVNNLCTTYFAGTNSVTPSFIYALTNGWMPFTADDMTLTISGARTRVQDLAQNLSNGAAIPEGDTLVSNSIVLSGRVLSTAGDPTQLQVELRPLDQPFTEINDGGILESGAVQSGTVARVVTTGLLNAPYHWRARAVDGSGNTSDWRDFGVTSDADFFVDAVNNPPENLYEQSQQTNAPFSSFGLPDPVAAQTFRAENTGTLTSITLRVTYINCRRPIAASIWSVTPNDFTGAPDTQLVSSLNAPNDNDLKLGTGSFYDFYPITWQFPATLTLNKGTTYALRLEWQSPTNAYCFAKFMGGGNMTNGRIYNLSWGISQFLTYDDLTMRVLGIPLQTPPVLTALQVNGFDDGAEPNMGTPEASRAFKIIYTDAENQPPAFLRTVDENALGDPAIVIPLAPDPEAPLALRDGNYANGEQFSAAAKFPIGNYSYYFETSDGTDAARYPSSPNVFKLQSGYSSVAFLPGLEASRLYKPGTIIENQLWEPKWNADVRRLYLNPDGTPQNGDIYTRDAVDKIYGVLGDIYSGFNDAMQKLVANRAVNEFEILPYDWRLQLDDVLASGKTVGFVGGFLNLSYTSATDSPYIIQEIERLAHNSATGKTTIIAHSNGGLLAKRLMKKLADKGEGDLVDKIILVAVPQTGTPSAIAALLHGHDQELGFGYVMSKSTARAFAENMPAAYNLLPDAKYFADVSTPVVTFDAASSVTGSFRNTYGNAITSRASLQQFLMGADGRPKPAADNTDIPNVLNGSLLIRASAIQDELDAWTPPAGVSVIQIAGWGATTLSGIRYTEKDNPACSSGSHICTPAKVLDYAPQFVIDGDGTVVVPSALGMGAEAERYYVNLHKFNQDESKKSPIGIETSRAHKDILEVAPLEELISNAVQEKSTLPQYITTKIPPSTDTRLNFTVHSPVSLDLYDEFGNHTGVSTTTNPYGDLQRIDEQIPNSYYMEFGEGKYAGSDGNGTTTVNLAGLALGTFTFDITETQGNTVVASTTFADIPVTASTTAVMNIANLSASSTPALAMDINGDGITDATISAGDGVSVAELISILKGIVKTLHLPQKKETKIFKGIDKLSSVIARRNDEAILPYPSVISAKAGIQPHIAASVIARNEATKQSYLNGDKTERQQKHRTPEAFKNLKETIRQFLKKNLLTKEEADELTSILEQIQKMMVK